MAWGKAGSTTLTSAGDDINVTSLADNRYYMVLGNASNGVDNPQARFRLNSDTGSNYTTRYSENGGSDATQTSQTSIYLADAQSVGDHCFTVGYIINIAGKEKLIIAHTVNDRGGLGASNDPYRWETVAKHVQTSNPINAINYFNGGAGSWAIGSECVVLGSDFTIAPPTVQDGAVFEETDTNKHYLLDDGTWTEI